MQENFEQTIRRLTQPINGQLPRPWMTRMANPLEADVFIVGMNQRNPYPAENIPHQRHIDALFNRNGEDCRSLYDEVTDGKPSPTRRNVDGLSCRLYQRGVYNVIETDVICYSTPLSSDLRGPRHVGGSRKGEEIFLYLLQEIVPAALVVHGVGAVKRISKILGSERIRIPESADEVCDIEIGRHLIIPVRSLAPPEFNKWSSWSSGYLDGVADRVRDRLRA